MIRSIQAGEIYYSRQTNPACWAQRVGIADSRLLVSRCRRRHRRGRRHGDVWPENTWCARVTCATNEQCLSIARGASTLAACQLP